ncbi:hypothetical protein B0T14DRAFT_104153 [Immersiella caudata]|uniref:Secreted protein n=1 Tax=Immersiella caudata TaxID=314043 RepID=A0AA39X3S5_9PEZI|nr:hypothetical protein B0T14DRAFT_104153 [Immersiella caudata]
MTVKLCFFLLLCFSRQRLQGSGDVMSTGWWLSGDRKHTPRQKSTEPDSRILNQIERPPLLSRQGRQAVDGQRLAKTPADLFRPACNPKLIGADRAGDACTQQSDWRFS